MQEKKYFYKKLAVLVLPIAVQNLMTALVSASDALMLGFVNQSSLSAVSLAAQVQFVLNLFYVALTIGATVLAAQYWGKGDIRSVEKVLAITLKISVLISGIFFLAALAAPALLMQIFTSDGGLVWLGARYLRAVSWSYLFMGISQIYLCIMKNSGRALRSTVYGSVAVVLNIALNAVLIFGLIGFPQMGTVGAAVATSISRGVELILVLVKTGWKTGEESGRSVSGQSISVRTTRLSGKISGAAPCLLWQMRWCGDAGLRCFPSSWDTLGVMLWQPTPSRTS